MLIWFIPGKGKDHWVTVTSSSQEKAILQMTLHPGDPEPMERCLTRVVPLTCCRGELSLSALWTGGGRGLLLEQSPLNLMVASLTLVHDLSQSALVYSFLGTVETKGGVCAELG